VYLERFRFENYKSYKQAEVQLGPGLNVLVGQNDAGKTSLLEALNLQGGNAHRSVADSGHAESQNRPSEMHIVVPRDEFLRALPSAGQQVIVFAPPSLTNDFVATRFLEVLRGDVRVKSYWRSGNLDIAALPFVSDVKEGQVKFGITLNKANGIADIASNYNGNGIDVCRDLSVRLRQSTYLFKAERLPQVEFQTGSTLDLQPDAANLAQVLNYLQTSNPVAYARFNSYVTEVFPHIRHVTVPTGQPKASIAVWTIDPLLERPDLAVPLTACGSGVGQILAMLCLVVTSSRTPRIILIDEPQSFLHPGAQRKLLDILKRNPQHQYVIATHSPTLLTAWEPTSLYLVRRGQHESSLERIDPDDANSLRTYLADIGARLSDVFGADTILWVEGQTEEVCVPDVLTHFGESLPSGCKVIGVLQTGDFDSRQHGHSARQIYAKLSSGRGLLPPAVGFFFDREDRSEASIEENSSGTPPLRFTNRRMYENYLLIPTAIADVVNRIEGFSDDPLPATAISDWFLQKGTDPKYFKPFAAETNVFSDAWKGQVNGARLLGDLFVELSAARVAYAKVSHGQLLTRAILSMSPAELAPFVRELKAFFETATKVQ
jgi:predicted ATPase